MSDEKINDTIDEVLTSAKVVERLAALDETGTRMFATTEEKQIGAKAIGAYIGVLTALLIDFMNAHPDIGDELGNIIGRAAAECTSHVL